MLLNISADFSLKLIKNEAYMYLFNIKMISVKKFNINLLFMKKQISYSNLRIEN